MEVLQELGGCAMDNKCHQSKGIIAKCMLDHAHTE